MERAYHYTDFQELLADIDPGTSFHYRCYHWSPPWFACAAAASDGMLFYELEGSISGPLQQPGSGSSSGFTQYASTLSAHSPPLTRFHHLRWAARRPMCGSSA